MIRRFVAGSLLGLCLVVGLAGGLTAQLESSLPHVLHPEALDFSPENEATWVVALDDLTSFLAKDLPVSRKRLERIDWSPERLAIFVGGLLEAAGYVTAVVSAPTDDGGVYIWVLVELSVADITYWIPVDVAWGEFDEDRIGRIPWAPESVGVRFDDIYLGLEAVLELEPNVAPVAAIRRSLDLYVKKTLLRFYADPSEDEDGELILFQWSIDGGVPTETTAPLLLHRFQRAGEYTIHLTVMDDRGASGSDEITIKVLEEEPDCRACDPDA